MNYAGIKYFDIANAPGIGVSLFVSGCSHHCEGCFNEVAWDYNFGELYTNETTSSIVEFYRNNPQVTSFSLLGGEPFAQGKDTQVLINLVNRLRKETDCSVYWVWSGYTFDEIMQSPQKVKLLTVFDVLVDGKFELNKKDLRLAHRGSSNQRIIDVPSSLRAGEVILWRDSNGI